MCITHQPRDRNESVIIVDGSKFVLAHVTTANYLTLLMKTASCCPEKNIIVYTIKVIKIVEKLLLKIVQVLNFHLEQSIQN